MLDYLFAGHAPWFTVPALIGTGIFIMRMALMLIGGIDDGDIDLHSDVDGQGSDAAFHVLSIQTVSAFIMGFGWGGFAAYKSFAADSLVTAVGLGLVVGVGFVWFQMILLKGVHDLQVSGNVNAHDAVGLHGDIYLGVPAMGKGVGRVNVVVKDRLREFNAVTEGAEIPRGTRVKVTKVEGNTLTVVAADHA